MRMEKRFWGLGTWAVSAFGVLMLAGAGGAQEIRQATTDIPGSVIVYPKVIWDGTRDTVIQLSNTSNSLTFVHCFYVNGAPVNPSLPPSATNPPQWVVTDFELVLTRQQPTMWVASAGRRVNFGDPFGSYGAGYDPGLIPPVPLGFTGELKCIEVDASGLPFPTNRLKGEATLVGQGSDLATYNAIALPANPQQVPGTELELTLTDNNPGGEYAACPDTLVFNHFAYRASQLALSSPTSLGGLGLCAGNNCPVTTELTMVPCSQDFENGRPGRVDVGFLIFDEFEARLSASTTVNCWFNLPLDRIAPAGPRNPFTPAGMGGSTTRHTRIRPVPGQGGVLAIAEERRFTSSGAGPFATSAYNLYVQGNRFDGATQGDNDDPAAGATDVIRVPAE